MKRCARYLGRGLVGLTITALGALYLGAGVWYLEGAAHWIPVCVALAMGGLVLCAWARSWRWAALGGATVITLAFVLATGQAAHHSRPGAHNLRVLTANLYVSNNDIHKLMQLVDETDPDVILLQEVNEEWARLIEPLKATHPSFCVNPAHNGRVTDLAIFSKQPMTEPVVLSDEGIPAATTTIHVDGAAVDIWNIHMASPFSPRRAERYKSQMAALRERAAATDRPTIFGGDLNSSLWSPLYRSLMRGTNLQNTRAGRGILGTWPSFLGPFRSPIDHILVTPGIEVIHCEVTPGIGSDHRPLIADLRVGPGDALAEAAP